MIIDSSDKADIKTFFVEARNTVRTAYGFGFYPERQKIEAVAKEALQKTLQSSEATEEEFNFYRSLRSRTSNEADDDIQSLKREIRYLEKDVEFAEKVGINLSAEFFEKSKELQKDYLQSPGYKVISEREERNTFKIENLKERILNLLIYSEQGITESFDSLEKFSEYRNTVLSLFESVEELDARHEQAKEVISKDALLSIDPINIKKEALLNKILKLFY